MALFNSASERKAGFNLALIAFCFAIVVVLLGAFTRLVDAGLGCPDWPGCYGHLTWPNETHEITRAEELFPHAPVETDKTWPEMVHRYFAGTLGLLIAALAFIAWKNRGDEEQPFRLPLFLLFLVVWQALFGMWTVTLKLWPQVVTLHLLGGMSVLSLLWLLTLRLDNQRWQLPPPSYRRLLKFRPMVVIAIILVVIQITLGGWTSSNYAAFACPDFPQCHNEWLPPMDLAMGFNIFQHIGPNYLGGLLENDARVAIHFMHRVGALVVTLYVIFLALRLIGSGQSKVTGLALILLAVLAIQVGLGISNIYFRIPLPVAVAHNGGGALLLLTLITIATRLWMSQPKENKK
jgi:cytochrome c oxidase assembly protein subunit 15